MRIWRGSRAGPALLLSLISIGAYAGAPVELNEVVVSGTRPAVERIGTVYEVDAQEIAQRGARTLDDAIELLPGVNIRTGGNGSPRIDVRGFRTRHVKLLLNGVPFGNTFDGQFDPTLIPSEDIARVKLTTGTSSSLYGDGAIGAVINVVTRQAVAGQSATTHAEYGSGDFYRVSSSYSWGDADTGVFVSGGRSARNGFVLANDFHGTSLEHGGLRGNSDRERNHGYFNLYRALSPSLEIGSTVTFARGGYGAPGTTVDDPNDVFSNRPRWQRVDDQQTVSAQVSLNWDPDGPLGNRLWGYINTLDENTNRYSDAFTRTLDDEHVRGTFNDDAHARVVGAHDELSIEHPFGGTVKIMAEGRQEHFAQDCMTRDIPRLPPAPPPVPTPNPNPTPTPTPNPTPDPSPPPVTLDSATSATLQFNYLATNNFSATDSTGQHPSVAELTLTNNNTGGVDFSFKSLLAGNFFAAGGSGPAIPEAYVSRLYLLADPVLDISQWQFVDEPASQGTVGGAVNFAPPQGGDVINNYHFRTRVGWQRPGGNGGLANPLTDGETALWSYSHARLKDLLSTAATSTGGRPNAYAAIELRQADASGFWGPSEQPTGGPGGLAVYLVAPTNALALFAPSTKSRVVAPAMVIVTNGASFKTATSAKTQQLAVVNVAPPGKGCGAGGDGSGGGTPTHFDEVTFGLRPFRQDRALTIATTALEVSFRPFTRLDVVVGYAQHWFQRDDGTSQWYGSYSTGLSYALTSTVQLRASAGHKIRMPSVQQLYDTLAGDPGLTPERAMTYEIGGDWSGWRFARLGLTMFRSDVRNFIERDPVTETFANNQRYRFQGLELSSHSQFGRHTTFDASYSYLDASDRSSLRVRDGLQYRPSHKLVAQLSRQFEQGMMLSASAQHVSDEQFFSRLGTPQTRSLSPYTLLNLRVSQQLFGHRLRVFVGADNLLNDNYAEAYGLPQAGRFVYGGFDLQLF